MDEQEVRARAVGRRAAALKDSGRRKVMPLDPGLTLGRMLGERIVIEHAGEELVLDLVETAPWQAKLHFSGSRAFRVVREEIFARHAVRHTTGTRES